mgnify:CR=1 FL=1
MLPEKHKHGDNMGFDKEPVCIAVERLCRTELASQALTRQLSQRESLPEKENFI